MSYKQPLGVADNKSYKDQYHFKDRFFDGYLREDLPSLNSDPSINTSIKENPYRSNVEIEKDEIILNPDMGALFKAIGKTHKQGGIDVMLKNDAFVFSDDKSLAFTERDHKLFEFKEPSNYKKKDKNTPAEILKRNVDLKHYNTLVSNLGDPKKDDLAKKSSMMMLEKYINTLGNIAYVQEEKKDFPTGIPSFSMGTAPVYDPEVKDEVMAQKQYAKYGGNILPIAQMGGNPFNFRQNPVGTPKWHGTNMLGPNHRMTKEEIEMQEYYKNIKITTPQQQAAAIAAKQDPAIGILPTVIQQQTATNGNVPGGLSGIPRKDPPLSGVPPIDEPTLKRVPILFPETHTSKEYKMQGPTITGTPPGLTPGQVEGPTDQGRDINWQFTPWQRVSQGYNAYKYASAKRYMPMRSELDPSYVDPYLVNPEQAIGDMQGLTNQSINALGTLNPILRNAQAAATTGDMMNRLPGIRSQYDNQNAGIMNQARGMNNQIANNARAVNMQNDQTYYQQSVIGQQNFNNLQSFLGDKYMSDIMTDVNDNQSLAYNLATMDNPAYSFDFRSGDFRRNPKDIRDVRATSRTQEEILQIARQLKEEGYGDRLIGDILKSRAFQSARVAKKGGKVVRNPYK